MPNYQNSVIYRIINKETFENLYVGSTTDYTRRMREHKSRCHNSKTLLHYNLPLYKHIREDLGGWNFVKTVMIEEYTDCCNKLQLIKREQYHIELLASSKNAIRSYRTEDQKNEYHKQYKHDNKEKIKEQAKQYYLDNADKIKEHQKQYTLDNKEKINEQQRLRRQNKKKNEQPELVQSTIL